MRVRDVCCAWRAARARQAGDVGFFEHLGGAGGRGVAGAGVPRDAARRRRGRRGEGAAPRRARARGAGPRDRPQGHRGRGRALPGARARPRHPARARRVGVQAVPRDGLPARGRDDAALPGRHVRAAGHHDPQGACRAVRAVLCVLRAVLRLCCNHQGEEAGSAAGTREQHENCFIKTGHTQATASIPRCLCV